jgi:O-antigen/teichoic acid export membrane protein
MLGGSSNADHAAGVVFAATMLVRIPVYVFQGTAASLLPNLTKLSAANDRVLFRRTIRRTCGVLADVAGVIVLFAATIGPYAMSVLFGSDFQAGRGALTLLGLGVGFYLTAATVSQGLLALDQGPRAAIAWGTAAIVFVTAFVFVGGSDVARVAAAFALATGICAALALAGLLWRFERAQHIST